MTSAQIVADRHLSHKKRTKFHMYAHRPPERGLTWSVLTIRARAVATLVPVLLSGVVLTGCLRPELDEAEQRHDEASPRPAVARRALDSDVVPKGITLHPAAARAPGAAGASASEPKPVWVVLGDDPFCAGAATALGFRAHLVCVGATEGPPAAALRVALKILKRDAGPAVGPPPVTLVADRARTPKARALAAEEPRFFARVAVWPPEDATALFGPTYFTAFGQGGGTAVVLAGAPSEGQGPTVRAGERAGVRVVHWPAAPEAPGPFFQGLVERLGVGAEAGGPNPVLAPAGLADGK